MSQMSTVQYPPLGYAPPQPVPQAQYAQPPQAGYQQPPPAQAAATAHLPAFLHPIVQALQQGQFPYRNTWQLVGQVAPSKWMPNGFEWNGQKNFLRINLKTRTMIGRQGQERVMLGKIEVMVWGQAGQMLANSLQPGLVIYVEGEFRENIYKDRTGAFKSRPQLILRPSQNGQPNFLVLGMLPYVDEQPQRQQQYPPMGQPGYGQQPGYPPTGYAPAPAGYAPPAGSAPASAGYAPPTGYAPTPTAPPQQTYAPPSAGYAPAATVPQAPAPAGYAPAPTSPPWQTYAPAPAGYAPAPGTYPAAPPTAAPMILAPPAAPPATVAPPAAYLQPAAPTGAYPPPAAGGPPAPASDPDCPF